MSAVTILLATLWLVVLAMIVAVFALARQVGVLFERISPMGALMIDAGPKVGDASPQFSLKTLAGEVLNIGAPGAKCTLLFFLSPTCPVCKKLLPILRSIRNSESAWLTVVLASDGDMTTHADFVRKYDLGEFPYVLSSDLGMSYRISRLPFGVLLGEDGTVRSKGLVNNREQLESLFRAKEMGIDSIQSYFGQMQPGAAE